MSLISRYFGNDMRDIFEHDVHDKFRLISEEIDELKRNGIYSISKYKAILKKLEEIDKQIYGYNVTLLTRIKKERIGKLIR